MDVFGAYGSDTVDGSEIRRSSPGMLLYKAL